MRRLLASLALLAAPAVYASGPGSHFSAHGPPAQVLEVAMSGARFTKVCGATCGTLAATCAAGSAMAAITDSSITKPYIVKVAAGIYEECVSIDNKTDIALIGSGMYATIIRPSVTAATDVLGGVIRIANATGTTASSARIEIANLTAWNDAYAHPVSPAIFVGARDPNANSAAAWMDVDIHNVRAIGNKEAVRFAGTRLTTDTNTARGSIRDSVLIAGAEGLVIAGGVKVNAFDLDILVRTNWCETATTTFLAAQTGTINSGSTAGTFILDSADDFGSDNGYSGRKIALTDTDGGGAGVCGATNAAVGQYWIDTYTTADDTASPVTNAAEDPTTGCTYTIDAVPNFTDAPCTSKDWTTIRGGDVAPYSGPAGIAVRVGAGAFSTVPDDNYINVKNVRIKVEANDFGPSTPALCSANGAVSMAAGVIQCSVSTQNITIEDVDVTMDIPIDLDDAATGTPDVSCFAITSETEGMAVLKNTRCTVNNTGDGDTTVTAFLSGNASAIVRVLGGYIDINNTGNGSAATKTDLNNTAGTLAIGNIVSDAAVNTSGTMTFLNGGTFDAMTGTGTLDFASALVNACSADLTITATGSASGDICELGVPNGSMAAGSMFMCWVSAANTVSVRHCCIVAASCDPASGTFRATVRKP